jgi:SAM-dependent methyltransferase
MIAEDDNFRAFSSPVVVELYANTSGLHPAEAYVFDRFVHQDASILDIGVGGGRTTPYLAAKASQYIGVDYIKAMIEACVARFPQNKFRCADATRLTDFEDASFDLAVFSFNGIDAIPTREDRLRCFANVFRVLKPTGLFIFSSHNSKMLLNWPRLDNAGFLRKAWRLARATITSVPYAVRLVHSGAFHTGAGYYNDPVHGGIKTYCATPELIEADVRSAGFQVLDVISNLHPHRAAHYFISSYYYVLSKITEDSEQCNPTDKQNACRN